MSETLIGPVPPQWRLTTLGSLCVEGGGDIQTGPFGSQLHASDYVAEGIPSIMPVNIGDNAIIEERIARIRPTDADRLSRYLVRVGDIVYSRRGDVERRALVRAAQEGWLCGTGCLRIRPSRAVSSEFLSYYLGHPVVREWIVRHAVGATMPNLNTTILSGVPVVVPPPTIQQAIVSVLGALDDKIAVNERIAATYEDLLRVMFEDLGIDMEQGAGEAIPLSAIVELNPANPAPRSDAVYLDMASVSTRTARVRDWTRREPKSGTRFRNGDTVMARITPCLENGKTAFVDFLDDGEVGIGSTEFIVLRARLGVPIHLPYFLARSSRFRASAIQNMVGSSGRQRVNASSLEGFTIFGPDDGKLNSFGASAEVSFSHMKSLDAESRLLRDLRDMLLPKLMSGEIRVREAEKVVEEAT